MQHTTIVPHCVGSLNISVMILLLKGLMFRFSCGNLKRPAKRHLLEKTDYRKSNELDTTGESRTHLTVLREL